MRAWAKVDPENLIAEKDDTNNECAISLRFEDKPTQPAGQDEEPEPPDPVASPIAIRPADLYGESTIGPDMYIKSRVHLPGGAQLSGGFSFWDRRRENDADADWKRIDLFATFDGAFTSWNPNYQTEHQAILDAGEGRVDIGEFEGEGDWKGEKWYVKGQEVETKVVTGKLVLRGKVVEIASGDYGAGGKVCFDYSGDELFSWAGSSALWADELELSKKRMGADFKMANFPWFIPDWAR